MNSNETRIEMNEEINNSSTIGTARNGRFMEVRNILNILGNDKENIFDTIPKGLKENKYFVFKRNGDASVVDDCGSWLKSSLKNIYICDENGNLVGIYKKKGVYRISSKQQFLPLETASDQRHHNREMVLQQT